MIALTYRALSGGSSNDELRRLMSRPVSATK